MARMVYGFSVVERSRRLRMVLIAAEPTFRLGFRALLESCDDVRLVSDAADARSGFHAIDLEKPEVVVMDIALRGMNGTAATREVKRRAPEARVLLLGTWPCERDVLDGFAAGADGFALKTEPGESLLYAIRAVGHGETYLAPDVRGLTVEAVRDLQRGKTAPNGLGVLQALSAREREVLDLVIKGWRNRDIAKELCVSIKTVDTHRTRINRKLRCRSSADLIRFAAENDLLRRTPGRPTERLPAQTVVVVVDNDLPTRGDLLRDMVAQGFEERGAGSVPSALADLCEQQRASFYVLDSDGEATSPAELYRQLVTDSFPGARGVCLRPRAPLDRAVPGAGHGLATRPGGGRELHRHSR